MIDFTCRHCGSALRTEDEHAGMPARCPKCKQKVTVPGERSVFVDDPLHPTELIIPTTSGNASAPATSPPQPAVHKGTDNIWSTADWYLRRFWANPSCRKAVKATSVAFVGAFWLFTYGYPPSLLILVNYASLVIISLLGGLWIFGRSSLTRKFRFYGAAGVVVLTLFLAGKYDAYDDRHTLDDGTLITTTYKRWGRTPIERFIEVPGSGFAWGPLTPSGKKHGKWTFWIGHSPEDRWYWYDEQVSEGQFVLRSK